MMGMEKMIAQMLGLSPEAMGDMITGFQTLLSDLKSTLGEIQADQKAILAKLEALENVESNDRGNAARRPPRSRAANGGDIASGTSGDG